MATTIIGQWEPLFATVKQNKLVWFGHVTEHDTLSKMTLHRFKSFIYPSSCDYCYQHTIKSHFINFHNISNFAFITGFSNYHIQSFL